VLKAGVTGASPELADKLQVDEGAAIVLLSRLCLSEGVPLAVQTSYLPHGLCHNLLQFVFRLESLYRVLTSAYGLPAVGAGQAIEAALA